MTKDNAKRLGDLIRARRRELKLTQADVQRLGGPSTATLRVIENGTHADFRRSTSAPLERILRWQPDDIDRVLAGGEPTPASAEAVERNLPPAPDVPPEPGVDIPLFSARIEADARSRRSNHRALRLEPGEVVEYATRLRNMVVHGGDRGVESALTTAVDLLASLSVLVEQLEIINHWIEERDNELETTTQQDAPSEATEDEKIKRTELSWAHQVEVVDPTQERQSDYGLANRAVPGKSRGELLREQQDRDAEHE